MVRLRLLLQPVKQDRNRRMPRPKSHRTLELGRDIAQSQAAAQETPKTLRAAGPQEWAEVRVIHREAEPEAQATVRAVAQQAPAKAQVRLQDAALELAQAEAAARVPDPFPVSQFKAEKTILLRRL